MNREVILKRALWVLCLSVSFFWTSPSIFPEKDVEIPISIKHIDTRAYPELRLSLSLDRSSPTARKNLRAEDLDLFESKGNDFWKLDIRELSSRNARAEEVRLIVILDSTLSVKPGEFQRSRAQAKALVDTLEGGDRALIYSLEGSARIRARLDSDRDTLKSSLDRIRRQGRITRIYDSLHTAIYTAKAVALESAWSKSGAASAYPSPIRTAVVLFTDGHDEDSFITPDDCVALGSLGKRFNIPVYTILYGRQANRDNFRSLANRTGGKLQSGLPRFKPAELLEQIRALPEKVYELKARSLALQKAKNIFPGESLSVRLNWKEGGGPASRRVLYRIPWEGFYQAILADWQEHWHLLAILCLAALILLVLLFLFLRSLFKDKDLKEEVPVSRTSEEYYATPVTDLFPESEYASRTPAPATPTQVYAEDDPEMEFIESFEGPPPATPLSQAEPLGVSPVTGEATSGYPASVSQAKQSGAGSGAGADVRDAPLSADRLHMKSYSYRILQDALRGAPAYKSASLIRRDRLNREDRQDYHLFLDVVVIGSDRWSNIHLDDRAASPIHARIKRVDGKFIIYDMVSGSGVFLNGKKLLRPRALCDGDELKLGHTYFRFRGDS